MAQAAPWSLWSSAPSAVPVQDWRGSDYDAGWTSGAGEGADRPTSWQQAFPTVSGTVSAGTSNPYATGPAMEDLGATLQPPVPSASAHRAVVSHPWRTPAARGSSGDGGEGPSDEEEPLWDKLKNLRITERRLRDELVMVQHQRQRLENREQPRPTSTPVTRELV